MCRDRLGAAGTVGSTVAHRRRGNRPSKRDPASLHHGGGADHWGASPWPRCAPAEPARDRAANSIGSSHGGGSFWATPPRALHPPPPPSPFFGIGGCRGPPR